MSIKKVDPNRSQAAAAIGAKGGAAGTGDSKRRSREFYTKILPAARAKAKAERLKLEKDREGVGEV